ncbi:stalk domain-containing protein [Ammoniphilus resinae]|uniref:Copper amine oxidase-like N-terminal domain-containing protein n=1 Tax=Ammoniphilus resinae TaxID=861532 RepID=A0ABS4GUV8_9BACL|nr:copper amine oxidase N-terminal domain-containing protein [Ammoniphilus resinae]MBP1934054.1 hypothetical protein [Ammoniphilus resinae]
MRKVKITGLAALVATILLTNTVQAKTIQPKENQPVQIQVNGSTISLKNPPYFAEGTWLIPLKDAVETLDCQVDWEGKTKSITVIRGPQYAKLRIGSKEAIVNEKQTMLYAVPRLVNGKTFVPLRFVAESLGAQVEWKAAKRTIEITDSKHYTIGHGIDIENHRFWLDDKTGTLYVSKSFVPAKEIGSIGEPIKEFARMEARKWSQNTWILTIWDNYGEPHINNEAYQLLVKDQKIIYQTKAYYRYWTGKLGYIYQDQAVFTDGQMIELVDQTGKVTQTYDLVRLVGEGDSYSIEGMGENYLLVKPNKTGKHILIDLKTNNKVLLYQQLLTKEEQEIAEKNDLPFYTDSLTFVGEKDGSLRFIYKHPFTNKEREVTYSIKK